MRFSRTPLLCRLAMSGFLLIVGCTTLLHAQAPGDGRTGTPAEMTLSIFVGGWFLPTSIWENNNPALGAGAVLRYGLSTVFALQGGISLWRIGSDDQYRTLDSRGNFLGIFRRTATSTIIPVEAGAIYTPELDTPLRPWISFGIGFYPAFSSGKETLLGGGGSTEDISTSLTAPGFYGGAGAAYEIDHAFALTLEVVYRSVSFGSEWLSTWHDSLSGLSLQAGVSFAL